MSCSGEEGWDDGQCSTLDGDSSKQARMSKDAASRLVTPFLQVPVILPSWIPRTP